MSSTPAPCPVNNALVRIDQICDYVPIASTITNLVDIFEKCAFSGCCSSESINSNRYFSHINDKSFLRCVILLVPILGNIIVGVYDLIQNHRTEGSERLSSLSHHAESSGSIKAVSSKSDSIKQSFASFIVELEKEIFPLYEKHEIEFDTSRIHGRMHIARAIIFSEVMARYYKDKGVSVDFDYVRRATGLHDAGRKGNGVDLWEKESCALLYQYLISKNIPQKEAAQKSTIILKETADKNSIAFKIFQSADCLDIMRPCTGNGGRAGFNPKYGLVG